MECAANYELKTECSVVADNLVLRIDHPKGLYRVRLKNIPRTVFTTPFLLSLDLYFDAPDLEEAQDIGDDLLSQCLNMLALATGASFKRHRIRNIVAVKPESDGMNDVWLWADSIQYEDPQPILQPDTARTIERLLEFDMPPAIRRAMRWFRLGINATWPDDQFMYFWFALEIVAEFQKSSEKVPDKCPHCHSPLYCESCEKHPVHKPYPKQAIRDLLKMVGKDCDDEIIELLHKTRNSLMHGSTLKEIEDSLPQPHEEIVDILGRLLWRSIVSQFPLQMFDGSLRMGFPNTFVHRSLRGVAHMRTIVSANEDGDLDLSFTGIEAQMLPSGPPQSAQPTVIRMTSEQYERLGRLRFATCDDQEMCRRIWERGEQDGDFIYVLVLSTDMELIKDAVHRGDHGEWQNLFREILEGGQGT